MRTSIVGAFVALVALTSSASAQQPSSFGIARGVCSVQDGQAYLRPHAGMLYRIGPKDVSDALALFPGRECRVEGTITRTGKFTCDVAVTRMVSPTRVTDLEVAIDAALCSTVRGKRVDLVGPAARAARVLSDDSTVLVDGWLLEDAAGTPTAVHADTMKARVTEPTALVGSDGQLLGFVPQDARVKVVNILPGRAGVERATVQWGGLEGRLLNSRLDVKAPRRAPPAPGLAGRV